MRFLKDFILNRHTGQQAFGIHRVTGIALALYLPIHIILHSTALIFGQEAYDRMAQGIENRLGFIIEYLIVSAVIVHMLNGIRILLIDFFPMARNHRRLFWGAAGISAIFLGISLMVFLQRILSR